MDDRDDLQTEIDTLQQLYKDAVRETENLKRKIIRLERDKKYATLMTENIERLRDFNAAERELQLLYNQLLLANCPDMIFVFDADLRLVLGTDASLAYLHYTGMEELTGKRIGEVFSRKFPSGWIQKLMDASALSIERQAQQSYSEKTETDQGPIYLDITVSPAVDQAGRCMGIVIVLHDQTEITRLKELAEDSSRAKSAFLANMSHEIRTPMNAIKGMTDLMWKTDLSSVQSEYLKNISNASASLIQIVNDILDYSKIDAQRMELVEQSYGFMSMISEVCNSVYLKATEKGLNFFVDIDPKIPAYLFGDEMRLKQVLFNLLDNAVKFTNQGFVRLAVSLQRKDEAFSYLHFSVLDSGVGIREEDKAKLYDVFTQLDKLRHRAAEGTGLGLSISKRIVELFGGQLEVVSEYGTGSDFSFSVMQKYEHAGPVADTSGLASFKVLVLAGDEKLDFYRLIFSKLDIEVDYYDSPGLLSFEGKNTYTHVFYTPDPWAEIVAGHTQWFSASSLVAIMDLKEAGVRDPGARVIFEPVLITSIIARLHGSDEDGWDSRSDAGLIGEFTIPSAHILVVDDNEVNLIVCEEILKHYGATVDRAESGEVALEMVRDEQYDLIFMDHMMPGMDGVEATRLIRSMPSPNRDTPIVALTANAVEGMHEIYLESGMNDSVSKPMEIERLNQVLLEYIRPERIVFASAESFGEFE